MASVSSRVHRKSGTWLPALIVGLLMASLTVPAGAVIGGGGSLSAPSTVAVAKNSTVNMVYPVSGSGFTGTVTASVAVGSGLSNVTTSGTTVTGNGSDLVTITGTLTDVNSTLATLTYTPATDFTGSVTMNLTMLEGSGSLYFSGTGHYYEYVTAAGITWTAARTAAATRTLAGRTGYLVTVTSAAENAFVAGKLEGQGWMGASDDPAVTPTFLENRWYWVTGPENGTYFYYQDPRPPCTAVPYGYPIGGAYVNWASGEPNDCTNESYAHFLSDGKWNDYAINNASIDGYVVEYGGLGGDSPTDASATVAITVYGPPAAPTGVSATGNDGSASISWTAPGSPAEGPPTGYRIQTSTDGSSWTTATENTGSASTSATVTGLTNGTLYYFRVAGINAAGLGEDSSSATGTPQAYIPTCAYNPRSYLDIVGGWAIPCWLAPTTVESPTDVAAWQDPGTRFGVANYLVVPSTSGGVNPGGTINRGDAANLYRRLAANPIGTGSHPFSDVPASARAAVDWLYSLDAATGVGGDLFDSDRPLTRAQAVTLAWRLSGRPVASGPHGFPDTDSAWLNEALAWAKEQSIVTGRSTGDFDPDTPITRGELLTLIHRWALALESAVT